MRDAEWPGSLRWRRVLSTADDGDGPVVVLQAGAPFEAPMRSVSVFSGS